jgi:hypothetical protein
VVGPGGLEPPTSASIGAERCAHDLLTVAAPKRYGQRFRAVLKRRHDLLVLARHSAKPLHKDHGAGEHDAERDEIAQTDQENEDAQHGCGPLRYEGWVYMTDSPIVVAAYPQHRSGRDYPEQADPEERRLIPRIVGNVVGQTVVHVVVPRLLRRSQSGVCVQVTEDRPAVRYGRWAAVDSNLLPPR